MPQLPTILLSSILLAVGCAESKDSSSDDGIPTGPADFEEVLTTVLLPSCGFDSCHGSGAGWLRIDDDQTEEDWLAMESNVFAGRKLITPGDASNSYLIHKMQNGSIEGEVMPPSGMLEQARINRVRRWIDDLEVTDSADAEPADFDEVLSTVLVPSCGFDSCHGSGAGYLRIHDGQSEEEWLDKASTVFADRMLITPGDAGNSYLIHKMEGSTTIEGEAMPPSGMIDLDRIARVRSWIDAL